MTIFQRFIITLSLLAFAGLASGCSDTWQGVKADTKKNIDKAGDIVVKAGEKMKSE